MNLVIRNNFVKTVNCKGEEKPEQYKWDENIFSDLPSIKTIMIIKPSWDTCICSRFLRQPYLTRKHPKVDDEINIK